MGGVVGEGEGGEGGARGGAQGGEQAGNAHAFVILPHLIA